MPFSTLPERGVPGCDGLAVALGACYPSRAFYYQEKLVARILVVAYETIFGDK